MKKIAFVVSGKSPKTMPGGLGAYSYNVSKILNSLGYSVYIFGFSRDEEVVDLGFAKLVHLRNPYGKLLSLGASFVSPLFVRRMHNVALQESPHEVLIYSAGLWGIVGTEFKQKYHSATMEVRTFVGYFSTYRHDYYGQLIGAPRSDYGLYPNMLMRVAYWAACLYYAPIEHRMLRSSDRVIVHYESTRNILLSEVSGLPVNRLVKIPYYIDLYERTSDTASMALGSVGSCCSHRQCHLQNKILARASIRSSRRCVSSNGRESCNLTACSAGNGIFLEYNRQLAARLGIEDEVSFLGFVDSVENILNITDIYVLPSIEEGSGAISLLEAMKKGVAILTTFCDGIPEDFVNGSTGLLVPPGQEHAMAEALEKLIAIFTSCFAHASFRKTISSSRPKTSLPVTGNLAKEIFSGASLAVGLRFLARVVTGRFLWKL